jgi:hypothetical protein
MKNISYKKNFNYNHKVNINSFQGNKSVEL